MRPSYSTSADAGGKASTMTACNGIKITHTEDPPLQARRRIPVRINSMSRLLMLHCISTGRLVCSIMALAGNKLTNIGSADTHSQLTFPTMTDTVAYQNGYFYRLPEPEKILTNRLPENVPTNNVTIYCSSLSHRHHAARQQEVQPQDANLQA